MAARHPKQLIPVAGRPLLAWTLERLLSSGLDRADRRAAGGIGCTRERTSFLSPTVSRWVVGGATRQLSVAACLETCPADAELVLVHDGARPAVAVEDLLATVNAVGKGEGAILGRPVADTLKRVRRGRVATTVDRSQLFRAETPQVFRRAVLAEALRQSAADGFVGTDEASIVERLRGRLHYGRWRRVGPIRNSPGRRICRGWRCC